MARVVQIRKNFVKLLVYYYLTLTRMNLTYSTNTLAQFMNALTQSQWTALKTLLRYLKGTLNYFFFLHKRSSFILKADSDSDWVGDLDKRNSTTDYILYL